MRRAAALGVVLLAACSAPPRGVSVVLVTLDGVRRQEVFTGADPKLIGSDPSMRAAYWSDSVEDRRRALMPFLWGTIARDGQLFGNKEKGSAVRVTNGFNVSYPGYNELLCGFSDPRITGNKKVPNANITVLEWLHGRPGFQGSVAAYSTWDVFPFIINRERCGFFLNAGDVEPASTASQALLERLKEEIAAPWQGSVLDAFAFHGAMNHLRKRRPRVFYLALGDSDEWAHAGRYDRYLDSIRRGDDYVRQLWEALQSMDEYRGRTTLVVTTDHGRGDGPADWRSHNAQADGSQYVWVAVLGPRTPPLGERLDHGPLTQSQVAATVADALGEDYAGAVPQAAPALPVR